MRKMCYLFLLLCVISCRGRSMQRSPMSSFSFNFEHDEKIDESNMEYQMYMAIALSDDNERYIKVKELLDKGADPNKAYVPWCIPWLDTNPLWCVLDDTALVRLLIDYGADVKSRPYVAQVLGQDKILSKKYPNQKWLREKNETQRYIPEETEVFTICQLLLEAGADPNMKALGSSKVLQPATDWNYNRYFKKHGISAINFAISENLFLIFDLLREYGALLDEDSILYAKQATDISGNMEMEDLVKAQWIRQNGN